MPYCLKCCADIQSDSQYCPVCGSKFQIVEDNRGTYGECLESKQIQTPPNIDNYLGRAFLASFVFLPFGIVALLYASRVDRTIKKGDYKLAQELSDKANFWSNFCWAGVPIIIIILVLIKYILGINLFE